MLNIIVTVTSNIIMSSIVRRQYSEIFSVKTTLPKNERVQIYKDTFATLCHKIGGIVANGTDSIIISSFIGITTAGIYSNYHMIIYSLIVIMQQVTGNFTSSLGNAAVVKTCDEQFSDYKKLLFATLWIASYVTTCVYVLIDKFMLIWTKNTAMILDECTVILITVMLFTDIIRYITTSYINGNGLFVKDKIRPLIEAGINLVVSIIAVKKIGLAGVFLGTIVSRVCTTMWREPYLVFKHVFHKPTIHYWKIVGTFFMCTAIVGAALKVAFSYIFVANNLFSWIVECILCTTIFNLLLICVLRNNADFAFFKNKVLSIIGKFKKSK
jgi:O-antigen/teichoic acid export membrane protein